MPWTPALRLDSSADLPLFLQIARAVTDDVQRGRLRPGDRLPGSRSLAASVGVHRNTVLAAYDELAAEGWVTTTAGSGTRVSFDLPERPVTPSAPTTDRLGFPLRPFSPTHPVEEPVPGPGPAPFLLNGGLPDLARVPSAELARALRRLLRRDPARLLAYGDPAGSRALRASLATMLRARRGLACTVDSLVVTRGSQMGLYLLAQALLRPGDRVLVEEFGYAPAWEAFRQAGAELVPTPVDRDGLDVDAVGRELESGRCAAIYTTPHHQFPTMAVMSAPRRLRLLDLARVHRVPIIEDDYDNEFHYVGEPVLPLAAVDRAGVVVYVGTLSKVLAPGLRIGWVAGPRELVDQLVVRRRFVDRQGDQAVESAVAELIDDGTVPRHVRRMRRIYARRQEVMAEALRRHLGARVQLEVPSGGLALWPRLDGVDVDGWSARARRRGVVFAPGSVFSFGRRPSSHARIGFGGIDEDRIDEAVRRLAEVLDG